MTEFDYIIVGGGAAGCVLANRLSAKPGIRVLVCEAGPDVRDGETPEQILDSFAARAFLDSRFLWNDLEITTDAKAGTASAPPARRRKYEQARVLGGGSSINGQLANRGSPRDYDEWEQRGAAGWRWETVLPYFKKLERDIDFEGPLHGQCGPMPIRRIFPYLWVEHAKAMAEGFRSLGFEYLEDQNGDFRDGYHPLAINNLYDRRVPTAIAYLGPKVRQRPNLTVEANSQVSELLFDGKRCVGVRTQKDSGTKEYRATREVIVSCGAIYSPAMLLRAGIGPAAELQAVGVPVRHDLPGVGKRLMDHPSVAIGAFIKPHARLRGKTRRHLLLGLRFSSGHPDAPQGDMAVSVSTKAAWHAVGEQIASVTTWVNKTFSEAGEVTLASADWRTPPRVDFRLLSDRRDLERMMTAMRRLYKAFDAPAVKAAVETPFAASFSERVRQVSVINRANAFKTKILSLMLDGPEMLRRFMFRKFILETPPLDQLLADDQGLEAFIRRAAVGVWHATSSCRMGASTDPLAVTDNQGRVYGVTGLRVVDASIMPVVPSANTLLTVLMLAEKIADEMLAQVESEQRNEPAALMLHRAGR
jgi:5-(hydroxymethyl)furfural/furfural oxidase